MTLRLKLVDGIWYATGTVHLPSGESIRVRQSTKYSTNQKTFAQARLNQILADAMSGHLKRPGAVGKTVKDLVTSYLKRPKKVGPTDQLIVLRFADEYGSVRLVDVRGQHILDHVTARGNTPSTMRREINAILAALNYGRSELGLEVADVKVKRPPENEHRERWLTDEERDRFVEAFSPHWRPFVAFLFFTGARLGEATGLRWKDVHEDYVVLRSRKGSGVLKPRTVPLHPACKAMLDGLSRSTEFVFRTPEGGAIDTHNFRQREWAAACKAAQIEDFRPHDARHTFASRLAQNGTPIPIISDLLGHSSLEMTKRYMQYSPTHRHGAVSTLRGFGRDMAEFVGLTLA